MAEKMLDGHHRCLGEGARGLSDPHRRDKRG